MTPTAEVRDARSTELDALIAAGLGDIDPAESERILTRHIRVFRALGYTIIPPVSPLKRRAPAFAATQIIAAAARRYRLTPDRLRKRSNAAAVVLPRSLAIWSMYHLLDMSYPQIGRLFGGMHHTTMLHNERKIERLRAVDADIQAALEAIEQEAGRAL